MNSIINRPNENSTLYWNSNKLWKWQHNLHTCYKIRALRKSEFAPTKKEEKKMEKLKECKDTWKSNAIRVLAYHTYTSHFHNYLNTFAIWEYMSLRKRKLDKKRQKTKKNRSEHDVCIHSSQRVYFRFFCWLLAFLSYLFLLSAHNSYHFSPRIIIKSMFGEINWMRNYTYNTY